MGRQTVNKVWRKNPSYDKLGIVRGIAKFVAELAGAAMLTWFGINFAHTSPIWNWVFWTSATTLVLCAFFLIIDTILRQKSNKYNEVMKDIELQILVRKFMEMSHWFNIQRIDHAMKRPQSIQPPKGTYSSRIIARAKQKHPTRIQKFHKFLYEFWILK